MILERIHVECHSGYKANERPEVFKLGDRRWEVAEIIDRWYEGSREAGGPALDYFKVRTREGKIFLIRYNALFDAWTIIMPGSKARRV
ncbi:MAG: hypothetical protein E4H15_03235 [Syntrophobacterales bacterium]|nr:MAG: hypothetical protein E4H15_03235 [Syntrophobacterales bacterium]